MLSFLNHWNHMSHVIGGQEKHRKAWRRWRCSTCMRERVFVQTCLLSNEREEHSELLFHSSIDPVRALVLILESVCPPLPQIHLLRTINFHGPLSFHADLPFLSVSPHFWLSFSVLCLCECVLLI